MKLSVIIVSYNVKYYVEQCLNSLARALDGIDSEIFVVDNHSRDDSVGYLSRRFPRVNIIDSNHNLGFARANNVAIRQSSGDYVLLLNPDTIVAEHTIGRALHFMDAHPRAGSAGVMMINPDGTLAPESRRGLPTPLTSLYKMTGLCARFPHSRRFARYYLGHLPWTDPAPIEVVSGAFCLLRRTALLRVGLLDEDFFMYGEDIDLSYRLLRDGWDNWFLPLPILHYKGESTQKSSFRYVHVFYQAMVIFLRKHYGHRSLLLTVPVTAAVYAKAAAALVRMLSLRLRRSLGFTGRRRRADVAYVFVGSQSMVDSCRLIARRKGLTARYIVADAATTAPLHTIADDATVSHACLVVDTDTFTYAQTLDAIRRLATRRLSLGTYSATTRVVITPHEIIL